MPTNDFKPFATGAGANVMSQADWVALAALVTGFQSGKASSAQINKAIRQALFISSALAQYTADKSGLDVLDDGNVAGFIAKMSAAFGKDFQPLDATLTTLAALTTTANKLPYFTGTDAAALTDLTDIGRDVIGQSSIENLLSYLGLGTAAIKNVGTGTNQIPDMGSFTSQKAGSTSNGWQKLPSGLIIQWYTGTHPGDSTAWSYNFPIPFPNAFLGDTAVVAGATNNRSYINGSTSSNTSRFWIVTKDNPSAGGPVSLTSIAFGW